MNPWTHIVGWTLIHFLWQGALLAVVAAAALRVCRNQPPNVRYAIACAALTAMMASPIITARILSTPVIVSTPVTGLPPTILAPEIMSTGVPGWTNDGSASLYAVWAGVDAALPAIVFVWLVGVAALMVRMAGGLWHVRRLQVRSLAIERSPWQATADQLAASLRVRVDVHVVESMLVDAPAAVGWLRPVVLLPIAAVAHLTPSQIEAILAHELIHIRRHDFLVNVAQTLAETILFFHPAVWWVSGQIRAEREHSCDDTAVQLCGDPVNYAAALAELEAWRSRGTTLALAATGGSLTGRVRRLLHAPIGHEPRSLSWMVTLGLTGMLAAAAGGVYVSSAGLGSGVPILGAGQVLDADPMASPESFGWQVRRTDHFDIHYYAALTPNLEPVARSAEQAYQTISSELRYDLSFRVPLIIFKTRSDFEQQTIVPEATPAIAKGLVTGFAEPRRNRVVLLIEEDENRLPRQITHELTHIFAFDVIPRSRANDRRVSSWIDEGLAEYMTGTWDPTNLAKVRDVVAAGRVPRMTAAAGPLDIDGLYGEAHLGHAVFEFIAAEYGKPAVWQFLLEVRRNVVDGAGDPYQGTFSRTPEEFDAAFAQYLQTRFGP